jgi:hypothetical protein
MKGCIYMPKTKLTKYQRELYEGAEQLAQMAEVAKDEAARVVLFRAAMLLRKHARRSPAEKVSNAVQNGCYRLEDIKKETKLSHRIVKISLKNLLTLNKIALRRGYSDTKGRPQKLYVPNENK